MSITEADVIEHLVREVQPYPLFDVCSSGSYVGRISLGHLPRLAALKAFVRSVSYWDDAWLDHDDFPPSITHMWASMKSIPEEYQGEMGEWLIVYHDSPAEGRIPVTVFEVEAAYA